MTDELVDVQVLDALQDLVKDKFGFGRAESAVFFVVREQVASRDDFEEQVEVRLGLDRVKDRVDVWVRQVLEDLDLVTDRFEALGIQVDRVDFFASQLFQALRIEREQDAAERTSVVSSH